MSFDQKRKTSCVIIGSGAGGMTTAITLARAGIDVTLVEEGFDKSNSVPFSLEEIRSDYRCGGQTLTIGPKPMNLGEGQLLGGGTAVNTGYYLRADSQKLKTLTAIWDIKNLTEDSLQEDFDAIEDEWKPKYQSGAEWIDETQWLKVSQASHLKVDRAKFIHHWNPASKALERNSVYSLWKNELEDLGVHVISGCRINHLKKEGELWKVQGIFHNSKNFKIDASNVFLCAGAIESAKLLRQSGITKNIGNNLQFHIFIRILAKFSSPINQDRCPLLSWKAYNENVTIGHSPDYPHLMALAFPEMLNELKENWVQWSSFYASIQSLKGRKIRSFSFFKQPLLFSSLTTQEKRNLNLAFNCLQNFLKEMGAVQTYPNDISLKALQSVHLFGSCPMGEDKTKCATDSWGKVFGHSGLYINDASLLGSTIGHNPQATIMAIARRNSRHFLNLMME